MQLAFLSSVLTAAGSAVLNPFFCEQFCQFIMETINSTLRGSQASGARPSFQLERGGTIGSHGMDEQIPTGLQHDRSTPADFVGKEAVGHQHLVITGEQDGGTPSAGN
ncbi:UNVERIFIED_CONTAM: hypothetical protein Slati_0191100 [Sesamum latifolium]|uniref:Secreted protein n=1 Tax=Sesamum latifolium TaxID=2727402 RepID=A0AAW2YC25_9LAMI